jgi:hypothetical protein
VVGVGDLEDLGPRAALDRDLLGLGPQRLPFALELVALAVDPLDEEILDVGHDVGEGPDDVVVLSHVDAREPGHRGAARPAGPALEPDLEPDPRHARRQVRIARDQRAPVRGQLAAHGPVVGAAGPHRLADRATDAGDLLRRRHAVAAPALLEHDRVADRIGRVEAGREPWPELTQHVGAQQLALPVGRQPEGEQLPDRQHVGRAPGLEVEAQELHLEGQSPHPLDRGGNPGAVAVEQPPQPGVELALLALCDSAEAERSHQPVGGQALGAGDLRQTP